MEESKKRSWLWIVVVLILIITTYLIIVLAGNKPSNGDGELPYGIIEQDHFLGNKSSKIELIEYSDLQCPGCRQYHYIVSQIVAEFGAHIKFAYRHFPLKAIHQNSQTAAQATEAAGNQGKFWEMMDKIFEKQADWSKIDTREAENMFIKFAEELSLDVKQFSNDLTSEETIDKVNKAYDEAVSAGLNSTPTFFLNGERLDNQKSLKSLDAFRSLIKTTIEREK